MKKVFLQGFAALVVFLFATTSISGNDIIKKDAFEGFSTSKIEAMPNSNKLKSIAATVDNNSSEKNSSVTTLQGAGKKGYMRITSQSQISTTYFDEHIASFDMKNIGTSTKLEPLAKAMNFNEDINPPYRYISLKNGHIIASFSIKDPTLSDRGISLKNEHIIASSSMNDPTLSDRDISLKNEHIIPLSSMNDPTIPDRDISLKNEHIIPLSSMNDPTILDRYTSLKNEYAIEPPNMKTLTLSEYGSLKNRGMSTILNPLTKGINSNEDTIGPFNMIANFNKASVMYVVAA